MEVRKYLETNENEITTDENLWDVEKVVLWGKLMTINAYVKK